MKISSASSWVAVATLFITHACWAVDLPPDKAERANRDAESPMRWILMNADRPQSAASSGSGAQAPVASPARNRATTSTKRGNGKAPASDAAVHLPTSADLPADLVPIEDSKADWDSSLVQRLRHGNVKVRILIDLDGQIAKAEAVSSSDPRLTQSALAAAQRWRFAAVPKARAAYIDFGFDLDH